VIRDGLIRTYGDLAKHLCSIDASSQALDLLKGALACWPDHEGLRRLVAGVCSRRARRLMEEGRLPYARVELEEARRQLQEGLRHQAESVDLLRDLANVHLMLAESYSQRQAGRGIRYFRQQNEKDQTTWQLHYKKALIHLERILQLDPGNERARSDRSQLREVLFVPASRAQRRRGGRRR
jgi:tetratricopeptide (TPR) repeat protein